MPNRILKESIRRSPEIDQLSWFEEVVYYRLLTVADDYGRIDGRIVVLTHDLFPTKDNVTKAQVSRAIKNMISLGLLAAYQVDGQSYLYFPTWAKHQTLRHAKGKYPPPPPAAESGSTKTTSRRNLPQEVVHDEPHSAAESGSSNTTVCRSLPQEVVHEEPQSAAKSGSTKTTPGREPPQTVVHEEPHPAADCGSTRAGAESESQFESEIESESPPPPTAPEESARARGGGGGDGVEPQDNPFGNRDGPRPSFNTLEAYAANNLPRMNASNMQELVSYRDSLPDDVIRYAIDQANANNKPAYSYVRAILNRYVDNGIKTLGDAKADTAARIRKQHPPDDEEVKWFD